MTDHSASSGTVLAVATGKGGAGKTTATVELAMALAEQGNEVVVVDCDIDMSGLGGHLGISAETTLHDVLAGRATVEDAIVEAGGFRAVLGDPGLERFAETDPDPDQLGRVIDSLRESFDVVLLDTSSNARTATTPLSAADHAVLVTTTDRPALAATRRTAEFLSKFDADVAGVVVTWTDHGAVDRLESVPRELGCSPDVLVRVPDERGGRRDIFEGVAPGYRELAEGLPAVGEAESDDETETADAREMFGDESSAESSGGGLTSGYVRRSGRLAALGDLLGGPRKPGDPPPVSYDPDEGLRASRPAVVTAIVVVQIALVGLVVGDPPIPLVRPILAGIYALFVPGIPVALLMDLDENRFPRLVVYVVGLSAVVILGVGAIISLLYPMVGIDAPLRAGSMAGSLTITMFLLCAVILARRDERPVRVPLQGAFSPAPLALVLVPFLSVFGITFQNATGNNSLLLVVLILVSVFPVLNASERLPKRWVPLAVTVVAAALLYHNSLFGAGIGGPSGAAHTLDTGVWKPSEASVLPNGVLFPTYAMLTGLKLGAATSTVNPLLVVFLPVILFEGYREQVGDRAAFASVSLFMFSFPFYVLYSIAGRVATPVFFLALEGLVLSDGDIDLFRKRVLAIVFGMGLAVSHYGTAYVAMVAFGTAFVVYLLLGVIDRVRIPLSRGSFSARVRDVDLNALVDDLTPRLLSPSFVAFYVVFVIEWYFYTTGGEKFAVLPRKIIGVVNRFFEASASGTAGSAVSKQYGSTSVAISRQLYILIGALMGIGLATTMFARVFRKDSVDVDDEFLALAVGFMSMLGASFFVVGFNVARIMMIVFTFTAVFAVYGLGTMVEAGLTTRRILGRVADRDPRGAVRKALALDFDRAFGGFRTELSLLSVILCAFLLLNSGVATVLVTHDYAPSNVITQQQLEDSEEVQVQLKAKGCVDCNIQSHAWLFSHRNRSEHAYGDFKAWAQVDFYRGPLVGQLSYYPKKTVYRSMWYATNGTASRSLVLVLDHNTDTGVMLVDSMYYWKSLQYLDPVTDRSHVVYTTGETYIYRSTDRATEEAFGFQRPDPTNVTNLTEFTDYVNRSDAKIGNVTIKSAENDTDDLRESKSGAGSVGVSSEQVSPTKETPQTTGPPTDTRLPTGQQFAAEFVAGRDELGSPR
ncbi:DUF2206 domain-containing protein [Halorussus lipolyticus]|uniref:DUF2206 domain-containing protein n=1 Tax=Halorussus lipolyticus TaxID=3034024 RepID=UPI0023E75E11|nr:DUF2206 domain-containing protein [Halorussus sp. DT80]